MDINSVMMASIGEVSNKLRVSFKKTVLIKDYETEVIECVTEVTLDEQLNGAQRMFVSAILQVQMEYTCYCNLLMKGAVTQTAFNFRVNALMSELSTLKSNGEAVLGQSLDKYLSFNNLNR